MADEQVVKISFREEDISDNTYGGYIEELEGMDDSIEIVNKRQDGTYRENSIGGATFDIATVSLAVSGADLLLNLYQISRQMPAMHSFDIEGTLRITFDNDTMIGLVNIIHTHEREDGEDIHLVDPTEMISSTPDDIDEE